MATTRPRRSPASVTRAAADDPADAPARDALPDTGPAARNGKNGRNGKNAKGTGKAAAAKAATKPKDTTKTKAGSAKGTRAKHVATQAPPDPSAILHRAVDEAARLLGTDGAMAYLLDESTGILKFATDAGITDDRRRAWVRSLRVDIGVGMFGRAVANDEVVMTGDYAADPSFVHFEGADRLVSDLAIRSFLVAPLSSGGRTFGSMGTFSSRANAFGDKEVALVRALADHAAAAMANADLIEQIGRSRAEVERRAETERALREIGGRIIGLRHPEEVLQLSVDEAARLLGADGARIDVLDEATGGLYWAYDATTGHRPGLGPIAGSGEAQAGEGISGKAVREMRPIFTGDYLNDDRFDHAGAPDAHVRRFQIRSVVAVPLIGDRGPLGTLTVYTGEPDAFGEDEARVVEALAGQAAIAMTNARLIEELDRSRDQFSHQADAERALREIAARITAIRDPSDLLQHVTDEAARLLRAERVRIDLIMPAAGRVGFTHVPGAGDIIGGAAVDDSGRPFTYGASGKAIATGKSVVSGDYENDDGFEHNPDLDDAVRNDGVKSLIVTPLIGESGMLGVLQVGSPAIDAFGPAEVGLVEALAHQAAIAIQNARLIEAIASSREEVRRRARAEQALREIAARITAIRDPVDLLKQVTDASRDLLDADRAELDLIEPDTGLVRLAHVSGDGELSRPGPTGQGGVPGDRGINGLAIAQRRAVVTADYLTDDRFAHTVDFDTFVADSGIRSVVVAPLFTDDGLLGVIKVSSTTRAAYDDEDAGLMEAFADQATVAIQNARLIEELGRSREEISSRADAEKTLREIAANISAIRDPDAVLQQTVDEARRLLASDGARIDLLEGDVLTWAYASGDRTTRVRDEGRDRSFRVGEGVAGLAVERGQTFLTDDYLADDRFTHIEQSDELVEATGNVSVLAAPMRGEHGSLGSISVSSNRYGVYDESSAELLQALADQAAITIQNARLIAELNRSRTELRRRAEEEQSLREIAARISATKGARDVLQRTVDEAARLLAADEARIDLIEPESGLLRWAYHSSASTPYGSWEWPDNPDEKIEQGISGLAVLEARVAWTGDYLHDPGFLHAESSDYYVKEIGINSVMSAPLFDAGRVFGALTIYTRRSEAWGTDDARLIEAIANQAAIAILTARLIEELDRSTAELARRSEAQQSLLEIAARITAIREPGPLLQQVVDAAKRLVAGDGSVLDLLDPGENILRWAYDSGIGAKFTAKELQDLTIPVGVGATGMAVADGRVVVAGEDLGSHFPPSDANDRFWAVTGYHSMIIAPISGEAGPLGALEVYSTEPNAFDDDDAAVIRSLAYQAAIAIQNARLIEELGRSREEIARRADTERSLREIAARITAIREPGDLLQHVVMEAARLLDSDGAIIDLLDPVTGKIEWGYDSGISAERRHRWRDTFVGEDVVRRSLAERATLFTSDYLDDPRFGHSADQRKKASAVGLRSLAIAPLVSERGALGTLTVFSDKPSQFTAADADLLGVLADQAAIAMTNARLIEELERSQAALEARAERERSLRDIAARITSLRDPGEILARVVEESRRLLSSDGAHLTRLSEDGTFLVPVIVAGGMDDQTEDWLLRMRFPLGGGINGLAAEEVRPIWTYDYLIDPRIPHEPEDVVAAERLGLRGMAAAPLRAPAGEVIGTLAISYRTPREIAPDELDLLQGLADQAAIALTNSNLYELLGESESRYRYLVQNSPDLIWSIDADARFTFVSDTCERLTGWKPEDLLGKHFGALVHESSSEVAQVDWTQSMTAEFQEIRGRLNLLHRDGHPIPAEFSAFGTLDAEGRFAGANGSVRDMSERERLERELRESESRFRFLIANSPDIIFSVDPSGKFSYVSDGVRRSLGVEPEDLIGTSFVDIIQYRPDEVPGERFATLAANPEMELTTRMDLRRRDGGVVAFEVNSVGVRRDGVFAGIQGAARDITEREHLEQELRESEERYRFLVDNSPDVVFATDAEGNFTYLSDTIEEMVGFPPDELIGGHFSRIVEERSQPLAMERWVALNEEPDRMQVARLILTRRDGSTVPVEVSSLGTVVDGAFAGIHGSTRDISERERLEQDLRRQAGELASSQERAHLARELHDSVTQALFSMTLVTRTTELLVDRDSDKAKAQLASLRDLQREALAEMRALIFELRPGNLEQDGLLPALRTHTAALQGRIGLPIVVTSDLKDRLPLDVEEVLYRIAQEALHNVVKHAAARQVTLSIERTRSGVRLRIADDGKGFDAASVPEGHLGLAGMRARAEKIGATMEVTSRPGSGTTIEVFLPEAAIEAARNASPAAAEPGTAT